jgi:hypothetical protein
LFNLSYLKYVLKSKKCFKIFSALGIGDWGLGIGDWGLGPIPNPQSPIPNPQSPFQMNLIYIINSSKINCSSKKFDI